MRIIRLVILALLFSPLLGVMVTHAELPRLELSISPEQGTLQQAFMFRVAVSSEEPVGAPLLEGGDDFRLSLVADATQLSGVGGRMLHKRMLEYALYPKKTGTLLTPSAVLEMNGEKIEAAPLQVVVREEPGRPSSQSDKDISLFQTLDKERAYLGQQIRWTLGLQSKKQIGRAQYLDLAFDDFFVVPFKQQINEERIIEGERFSVNELRKALFPLSTGELKLPPRKMSVGLITQRVVEFPGLGGFFSMKTVERNIEEKLLGSNEAILTVQPLPHFRDRLSLWGMRNAPVGPTRISARLNTTRLSTGETAVLSIEVASLGNISSLQSVPLPEAPGLRTYPHLAEGDTVEHSDFVMLVKRFQIDLVPMDPGVYRISIPTLSYFLPEERKYKEAEVPPLVLTVMGSSLRSGNEEIKSDSAREAQTESSSGEEELPEESWIARKWNETSKGYVLLVVFLLGALFLWAAGVRQWQLAQSPSPAPVPPLEGETVKDAISALRQKYAVPEDSSLERVRGVMKKSAPSEAVRIEGEMLLDELEELLIRHGENSPLPLELKKRVFPTFSRAG